jgi:chromosomal replication initiation ATPase DnaA
MKIKAEVLLKAVCHVVGIKRGDVTGAGKDRHRVRARELACYVGTTCTKLSVKNIAEVLGVERRV